MATQEAGVRLILWMGDSASAMQFDGLITAANAQWCFSVVRPVSELGPSSWYPAVEDGLIINTCSCQLRSAGVEDIVISQRPARDLTQASRPDIKLPSFLSPQRKPCEELHQLQALSDTPYDKSRFGLVGPWMAGASGFVRYDADSECVADQFQNSNVIGAKPNRVARIRPFFPMGMLLVTPTQQREGALPIGKTRQPVTEGRVYGIKHI